MTKTAYFLLSLAVRLASVPPLIENASECRLACETDKDLWHGFKHIHCVLCSTYHTQICQLSQVLESFTVYMVEAPFPRRFHSPDITWHISLKNPVFCADHEILCSCATKKGPPATMRPRFFLSATVEVGSIYTYTVDQHMKSKTRQKENGKWANDHEMLKAI